MITIGASGCKIAQPRKWIFYSKAKLQQTKKIWMLLVFLMMHLSRALGKVVSLVSPHRRNAALSTPD